VNFRLKISQLHGGNNFNDFAEKEVTKFREVFHPAGCFRKWSGCCDNNARHLPECKNIILGLHALYGKATLILVRGIVYSIRSIGLLKYSYGFCGGGGSAYRPTLTAVVFLISYLSRYGL